MRVGMLWYDDSNERDLTAKIDRAVHHYTEKYGVRPTLCYVHPSVLSLATPPSIDGVSVRGTNAVLPHHLWIGRGPDPEAGEVA